MAEELQLKLLGNLEIRRSGNLVTGFTSNKVQALLCYLAVTGRPHLRPALAGLLWGELPEASALNGLRQALTNLRQLVGPHVSITRADVALNLELPYQLDVQAFEARVAAASVQGTKALEEAVALYRGDFLEGFYVHHAPAFEDWALTQQARLHELAVQALHALAAHYAQLGQPGRAAAIDYTTRLLALEPWREEAHRQLMLLLAAGGQRSAALAQYETCRRLLAEELGVEPSAEIGETYALLLRGERPPEITTLLAGQERPPRKVGECPYRGLAAFQEADAPFFFGREVFAERLVEAVERPLGEGQPMVCIVGSSGSGKSSAVFAGLLPRLRRSSDWRIVSLRPGAQPFYALANALLGALAPTLSVTERLLEARRLADALAGGDLPLLDVVAQSLANWSPARRLLLVIDQFEELYTLCPDAHLRRRWVDVLLTSLGSGGDGRAPRLVLLLTMRADFMGQALAYRPLADALQEAALMQGPMNRDELRAAIERPAEAQGAAFEAGLVARILDDVGEEPGNLPLLEFALTLLWEPHSHGWLTHAGYEEIGRVDGALARYADEVFAGLAQADQAAARRVFVQLVRPGEGTEDTRRSATRSELGEENWRLVQYLADKRLVVTGRDAAGMETVEVVHEALIQSWGQLQGWMAADRAFRTWQERMRAGLRQWQSSDQDEGALLRGSPLLEAEHWLAERPTELSQADREFIQAGMAQREAVRQRELEAARRLAEQVRLATSRELAAAAVANVDVDPERSVLLALEALATTDTLEARNALHRALPELRVLKTTPAHESSIVCVAFGPDGTILATGSEDKSAKAWDALTHRLLYTVETGRNVLGIAFSPDGSLLATSGMTDVLVCDSSAGQKVFAFSGESIGTAEGFDLGVGRIAFSPDGARLAVANMDGRPKVWDVASRGEVMSLPGHIRICKAIAYSPDGRLLATGGDDGIVKIWDAQSGQELLSLAGHSSYLRGIAFRPDGERLLSADDGGTLKIWDVITGETVLTLTNPSAGGFRSALYLPDGERVVTTGYDGTARVWHAETGRQLQLLAGHNSTVTDAAVSPDGFMLATSSADTTLKTWDLGPGRELLTLVVQPAMAGQVAYSRDGTRLAAPCTDGLVRIWDPFLGELVAALSADHPHPWRSLAYSPDGTRLAAGALDGAWSLWDLDSGRMLMTAAGHASWVQGLAFSPLGTKLATAGFDGKAKVWDIQTPLQPSQSTEALVTFTKHIRPATSTNWVFDIAFSPNGRCVASAGSDAMVRVWDAMNGEELLSLPGGERAVLMDSVAWSPDGSLIAGGEISGAIRLWEAATGKLVRGLSGHSAGVVRLAFSPDSRLLASAGFDLLAKVWDIQSGQETATLYGNRGRLMGVAFSPDGSQVATGGEDGTVRIYTVQVEELVALARSRVTRSLTREECQKYLHVDERP